MGVRTEGNSASCLNRISLNKPENEGIAQKEIKHKGLKMSVASCCKRVSEFFAQVRAKIMTPTKQERPSVRIEISNPIGDVHITNGSGGGGKVLESAIPLSGYSPKTPVEAVRKHSFDPELTASLIGDNPLRASQRPSETAADDSNEIVVPPHENGEAGPGEPDFGLTALPLPEAGSEFYEEPAYETIGVNSSFAEGSAIESDAETMSFESSSMDENDEPLYTLINKTNPDLLVRKTAEEIKSAAMEDPESTRDADTNMSLAAAVNTTLSTLSPLQRQKIQSKMISNELADFRAANAAQKKDAKKASAGFEKKNAKPAKIFHFSLKSLFGIHKKPDPQAPALPASSPPEQITPSPIESTVQNGIFDMPVFDTAAKVASPVLSVREQYDAKVEMAKNHVAKEIADTMEQYAKLEDAIAARYKSIGARIGGEG